MSANPPVYEIVKWKTKKGVSDQEMIEATNAMVSDLKCLNGFLHQTLYKTSNCEWVDVYYWETEVDAHASNEGMADKESFNDLIGLIEPESVSIEVLIPLQLSGTHSFRCL